MIRYIDSDSVCVCVANIFIYKKKINTQHTHTGVCTRDHHEPEKQAKLVRVARCGNDKKVGEKGA